ncbi:hypothetical protein MMC07_005730 [Pseudocyphellaria aurata]|nr:hypothetical protein [Pseudocyphellaria aurata]
MASSDQDSRLPLEEIIIQAIEAWGELDFMDQTLWEAVTEDFEGTTEANLKTVGINWQRKLRDFLRQRGVWNKNAHHGQKKRSDGAWTTRISLPTRSTLYSKQFGRNPRVYSIYPSLPPATRPLATTGLGPRSSSAAPPPTRFFTPTMRSELRPETAPTFKSMPPGPTPLLGATKLVPATGPAPATRPAPATESVPAIEFTPAREPLRRLRWNLHREPAPATGPAAPPIGPASAMEPGPVPIDTLMLTTIVEDGDDNSWDDVESARDKEDILEVSCQHMGDLQDLLDKNRHDGDLPL